MRPDDPSVLVSFRPSLNFIKEFLDRITRFNSSLMKLGSVT